MSSLLIGGAAKYASPYMESPLRRSYTAGMSVRDEWPFCRNPMPCHLPRSFWASLELDTAAGWVSRLTHSEYSSWKTAYALQSRLPPTSSGERLQLPQHASPYNCKRVTKCHQPSPTSPAIKRTWTRQPLDQIPFLASLPGVYGSDSAVGNWKSHWNVTLRSRGSGAMNAKVDFVDYQIYRRVCMGLERTYECNLS
jgi:hypothetical protein